MARRILPHSTSDILSAALLATGEVAVDETLNALRIGDGSTVGGQLLYGLENPLGFSAVNGDGRGIGDKVTELGASILDYGAVANVNTSDAANANRVALERAFANNNVVSAPGDLNTFYALPSGCVVPAAKTLRGTGVELRMRGEGISVGSFGKLLGFAVTGLNPVVAVGTKGSGGAARTSPTPDSLQYSLVTLNTVVGCEVRLTYLGRGLLNGMQMNNGSRHIVHIVRAENFGNDTVFSPTEGAAIYAPAVTGCTITIEDCAQTYGLGAVMGGNWSDMVFNLFIHDTRRAALHSGLGVVTGPGNIVNIKAYRLGGLAPVVSTGANHNQTGCGIFWAGNHRAEYVKVINPTIIDFAENAFEGPMEIVNPIVEITNVGGTPWDASYTPPNPGVFYGNQKVYGGTANNCRGWVLHTGGEEGAGIFDVVWDGVSINNPRAATINGVPGTAPMYAKLQVVGSGNVADNITVRNVVGYDSAGIVVEGFSIQGTDGGSFSNRCQVTNNRSTTNNNGISPSIRQFGNSWNPLNNKAAPHYMGVDSEEAGGGFKRSYWGFGIEYSTALGSWRLDDTGTDRTLIAHGNNTIQIYVIPSSVAAGALANSALNAYIVFSGNKAGFGVRQVATAERPDAAAGAFPGLMLFDYETNELIFRNAANSAYKVVTAT